MSLKGLTKRQFEVLSFIESYIAENHYSPSYREIMKHFGFQSVGSVAKHIFALKRKGFLIKEKHCSRSLALEKALLSPTQPTEVELPYIGYVSANTPIEMFPQSQTLAIPKFLVPNPDAAYVIRARGNSLHEEMICDSDLLIIETRTEPFDGEVVIASTQNHHTLIKRYHPEGSYIRLSSQSPFTHPLIIRDEDLQIHGIITSLFRFYS